MVKVVQNSNNLKIGRFHGDDEEPQDMMIREEDDDQSDNEEQSLINNLQDPARP
jgi:hypothetical protein